MKKIFIATLASALFIGLGSAHAQSSSFYKTSYKNRNSGSFSKGSNVLSFGMGAPNIAMNSFSSAGTKKIGFGPAYAKYEYGIMDEVGIGVRLGLASGHYKWNNTKANNFALLGNVMGYYHFNKLIPVKQLDVYAGVGIGFRHMSYERILPNGNVIEDSEVNPIGVGLVGAKWYFTRTFGVYAEVGYDGLTSANVGISLRF
jgi:hypothetical protein